MCLLTRWLAGWLAGVCVVQAVKGGEGLPVAVQCVALPWQEELCLRFMKEVETLVRERAATEEEEEE